MQIRMGIALSNCNIHYKYILLIIPDITVVLRSLTKLNYLLKTVLAKLSDWNQPNGQSMFSLIQVHLPILQFTQVRHFFSIGSSSCLFFFFLMIISRVTQCSVLEQIWVKGSYLSQWLPQGHRVKGDPLRSQNHDELKSSTLGPTNNFFFKFFSD